MIRPEYIKAARIIEKSHKVSGYKVRYESPNTDIENERWGDTLMSLIYRLTGKNILHKKDETNIGEQYAK